MKRNALLLLGLVLATGLIAAGCGGDDDDGGDALTKEEYLAQGNANCEAEDAKLNQAGPESEAELPAFIEDTFVPNIQGQIDYLRDGIPEGDEDQVNQILDETELALQDIKEDPSLAGPGATEDPFADPTRQLHQYGLTSCGSDS